MVDIISRAAWGFDGWNGSPYAVGAGVREFTVDHWEGGPTGYALGAGAIRAIHAQHKNQGWAGIGYNFVVTNDGATYEGRGWNLVGAHCPKFNKNGIGVQVHIGQGESASNAAEDSVAALHQMNIARAGHGIGTVGHSDGYQTECPGAQLLAWAHAGMHAPGGPVYSPLPPVLTVPGSVSLAELIAAARADSARPQGGTTPGSEDDVLIVESALVAEGLLARTLIDGSFGSSSVAAYKQWQIRLGYTGANADGIPGLSSLFRLGIKYGFGVVDDVAHSTPPPPVTPPPPAQHQIVTQGDHGGVYLNTLHRGSSNSDSVRRLQQALRDYPGISTIPLNPSGVTGTYGSETVAMVDLVYRTFDQWQPGQGWASGDTGVPGRTLLAILGLRVVG